MIKVLRGKPTSEELAAVLAVLQARNAARAAAEAAPATGGPATSWNDRSRTVRQIPAPGAYAWRTSVSAH